MEVKQQIITKSAELFMRYGIKSVTMDDIARELGISKKTLYQYVDNKSELIEHIFQMRIEAEKEMMAVVRAESQDAIEEMVKIARYVIQYLRQLSPTTVYDLQKYYRSTWKQMEALHQGHVYQVIRENIERGIKQGLYRSNMNPDIIARLYVSKSSIVADEDIFSLREYNIENLFREHILYHIYGIASQEGLAVLEHHLEEQLGEID